MIKKLAWLLLAAMASLQAASFDAKTLPPALKPTPQQGQIARLSTEVLTRYHYKPTPVDDALSEKIFDHYLKSLDSERLFFLQSDIDQFSKARLRLDDALRDKDLSVPFLIFNSYVQRAFERYSYARSLLKEKFDFKGKESYVYLREKEPWSASQDELRDLWRLRVKNDWLRLKLAGSKDKDIAATLDKRYLNFLKRISRGTSDDAFQTFMNAYTMAIEPHTNYLGVRAAKDFDISMKLSLVGIGAVLAERNDYTVIRELVPGGPAALSKQLKVGDRIVGVGQDKGAPMVDIVGWRLDDAVTLIRGPIDSTVLLDILPANAGADTKPQQMALVRKKINLEEQAAKQSILSLSDGEQTRRVGVITLPSFYEDFDARQNNSPNFKSATRDVARLLGELKTEKVDAVLVDLRNNGGGSLTEAIEMTGLFVGKGPVLQQRDAKGGIKVLNNRTTEPIWDGALGVLINRGSASASEIFAAAIQDYDRGWIIGEPSYGKGTVQTIVNLDQMAKLGRDKKDDKSQWGKLKFTIAQFFRVNGGTTQLRGVAPDFAFPTTSDTDNQGESSFDNALPWMQIKAADYTSFKDMKSLIPALAARADVREKNNKGFLCQKEAIAEYERQLAKNQVTLNEAERRQEKTAQEARQADCDEPPTKTARTKPNPSKNRSDDGLQADERSLATELADEASRKEAKDVFLEEAAQILADSIPLAKDLQEADAKSQADNKPARRLEKKRWIFSVAPSVLELWRAEMAESASGF